jgi:mannitol/fructose-specific phosphotransferase system IIA component (Ntr-type)
MQLTEILSPAHIQIALAATTRDDALRELVALLAATGEVDSPPAAMAALLDRERTRTTGIGGGLALPHGKTHAVKKLVAALGKSAAGLDFQSIDGRPAHLIVMLLSPPEATTPQIQALARISRILSLEAMRKRLDAAATPEALWKALAEFEKQDAAG